MALKILEYYISQKQTEVLWYRNADIQKTMIIYALSSNTGQVPICVMWLQRDRTKMLILL